MVELIPMSQSEFDAYLVTDTAAYAESNVRAGYWSPDEAPGLSRKAHESLLPQGLATPGHHIFSIVDSQTGQRVGAIWLAEDRSSQVPAGFIYDLRVDEPQRGRGLGKQAMLALEGTAKELGLRKLYLQVFAYNDRARALYDKLGYHLTGFNMGKDL